LGEAEGVGGDADAEGFPDFDVGAVVDGAVEAADGGLFLGGVEGGGAGGEEEGEDRGGGSGEGGVAGVRRRF